MMLKAERREKKRRKKRYGMRVRGHSVKSVLLALLARRKKK